MPKFLLIVTCVCLLASCDKTATHHNLAQNAPEPTASAPDPHDLKALAQELGADNHNQETPVQPILTNDGKIQIDWQWIDTKEPKADLQTYVYPIALDSQAVKNYASTYQISDKQAQHSMVVAMAAPEALGKVLDQLQGKYLGHSFSDGAQMSLIINTTADVVGERHDYVFADTFGRGLVLPIVINPQSAK